MSTDQLEGGLTKAEIKMLLEHEKPCRREFGIRLPAEIERRGERDDRREMQIGAPFWRKGDNGAPNYYHPNDDRKRGKHD